MQWVSMGVRTVQLFYSLVILVEGQGWAVDLVGAIADSEHKGAEYRTDWFAFLGGADMRPRLQASAHG